MEKNESNCDSRELVPLAHMNRFPCKKTFFAPKLLHTNYTFQTCLGNFCGEIVHSPLLINNPFELSQQIQKHKEQLVCDNIMQ